MRGFLQSTRHAKQGLSDAPAEAFVLVGWIGPPALQRSPVESMQKLYCEATAEGIIQPDMRILRSGSEVHSRRLRFTLPPGSLQSNTETFQVSVVKFTANHKHNVMLRQSHTLPALPLRNEPFTTKLQGLTLRSIKLLLHLQ